MEYTAPVKARFDSVGKHRKMEPLGARIKAMVEARAREDFAAAVRALDRILISGHYVIPLYHIREKWVAHWAHVKYPDYTPLYGYDLSAWWSEK